MISLKTIDRLAVLAIASATLAIPLASCASLGAPGARTLDPGVLQTIRPGMKASDVLERMGPPQRKERFERTHTTAWDYQGQDGWGYDADFSVIVDDSDVVVGRISVRKGE